MSKVTKVMSALEVSRLNEPGTYAVGGVSGLHLQVIGNSRSWILRCVIAGKRRRMGLGGYPSVTLAQAREKARTARELIDQGIDPIDNRKKAAMALEKEKEKALTFEQASHMYINAKEPEWKSQKHRGQWEASLATYAFPIIGKMLVSDIDQTHVLKILEPIWRNKTETANRVRGRIELILDWAAVRHYRDTYNPARWRGQLDMLLPKPTKFKRQQHLPAMAYQDVPLAVARLMQCEGFAASALLFLILTATRSGEVLGLTWPEIDIKHQLWTIPAERMKAGNRHRVPLSTHAIALLKKMPRFAETNVIFPSSRLGQQSNMSMIMLMRRLHFKSPNGDVAVPHGFRSSFRDWASDCAHAERDVAEMALAHTIESKTEAAYRRGDMLDRRAPLMQTWADYCWSQVK